MPSSYELYRTPPKAETYISVTIDVRDNKLQLFDHTLAGSARQFFGKDELERWITIDAADARKILRSMGEPPGRFPLDRLALLLAERLHGRVDALSRFEDIAKRAGVDASVEAW